MKGSLLSIFLACMLSFFTNIEASQDICLSGKLVQKYYRAPPIIKNPAFGWYLELDQTSEAMIDTTFKKLTLDDQRIYKVLDVNLKKVHLMLWNWNDKLVERCRSLKEEQVTVKGSLSSPHLSHSDNLCFVVNTHEIISKEIAENRITTPSNFKIDNLYDRRMTYTDCVEEETNSLQLPDEEEEHLVSLKGKLLLRLSPGPPEYSSIEMGDRADYFWLLQMNEESLKIATTTPVPEPVNNLCHILEWSNYADLDLAINEEMKEFCCRYVNEEVVVQGYLFHAHTAHHYTPILMDVKKIH